VFFYLHNTRFFRARQLQAGKTAKEKQRLSFTTAPKHGKLQKKLLEAA